jgi:tetratricopeptide (TPR) repeat protein
MSQVKRKSKKRYSIALALVCLVFLLGFLFRPHIAWGLVCAGNEFFGGHLPYNLTLADGFYWTALAVDTNVPDAWHQRARIAFLRSHFATALERINTQIKIHGDSLLSSYYIRGLIEGYMKNYPAAEKDFTHYVEADPDNWAARNDLAWIYFSQGKFQDAAAQTSVALQIGPDNPWLLLSHAMALYNLGDAAGAKKELEHAQHSAALLTEDTWRYAYPGNDPRVAAQGLAEFRQVIDTDLTLVNNNARADTLLVE